MALIDEDPYGICDVGPLLDELAPLGEDLDPIVPAVADVDAALVVHGETVYQVELSGAAAGLAPLHDVLAVGVVFDDTSIPVAVAEQEAAVRKERQHGRFAVGEGPWAWIRPRLLSGRRVVGVAQPHHELTTVVAELEDLHVHPPAAPALDDPDMALRIVGADVDLVGLVQRRVPLRPVLDHVTVPIDDYEIVRAALTLLSVGVPIAPYRHDDPVRVVHRNTRHLPPGPRPFMVRRRLPPTFHTLVCAGAAVPALHDLAWWSGLRRCVPGAAPGPARGAGGGESRQPGGHNERHPDTVTPHDPIVSSAEGRRQRSRCRLFEGSSSRATSRRGRRRSNLTNRQSCRRRRRCTGCRRRRR